MTTHANPLVPLMLEAQQIVVQATGAWADKAAAIERLSELLCTPQANLMLQLASENAR